jgi:Zn-dependent protease
MDFAALGYVVSTWALPVLLAITLHEAGHAYAAYMFGDSTAKDMGRLTLNPIAHIDKVGTLLLPGFLVLVGSPFIFGYAKPVPVRFNRLSRFRLGMAVVAAAGPATNIFLALVAVMLMHLLPLVPAEGGTQEWVFENLRNALIFNCLLTVLNLLPMPLLDGGKIAIAASPQPLMGWLARLERPGLLIFVGIFFLLHFAAQELDYMIDPAGTLIVGPALAFGDFLLQIGGF